jgi:hypothetical protein
MVEVRLVGFAPARVPVALRGRDTASVEIVLRPAATLPTVTVTAPRLTRILAEFEQRRKLGGGYFLREEELKGRNTMRSVFLDLPAVQTSGYASQSGVRAGERGGGAAIMMRSRNAWEAVCEPAIFIDGGRVGSSALESYSPADLVAVEVYIDEASAPQQYRSVRSNCGVVLVWTRFLR